MVESIKKIAIWAGPAIALLAFYMAVWGVPDLAVTALLIGAGGLLSWGVPWIAKKLKSLIN